MALKIFMIKLVLIFYFVWAPTVADGLNSSFDENLDPETEIELMEEFPGLFKSEEDIKDILEEKGRRDKMKVIWETLGSASRAISSMAMDLSSPSRGFKDFETMYHACCITDRGFKFFKELDNQKDHLVRLVQMEKMKQWFLVDTCGCDPNCKTCTCKKESRYYTALIYNPDYPIKSKKRFVMSFVKAFTVCRCVNKDQRPPRAAGSIHADKIEL